MKKSFKVIRTKDSNSFELLLGKVVNKRGRRIFDVQYGYAVDQENHGHFTALIIYADKEKKDQQLKLG